MLGGFITLHRPGGEPHGNTLTGKTTLVTGATAGIGYAIAVRPAAEGAVVVVPGRNAERGETTIEDIKNAGGRACFVAADVSVTDDVRRLADEAGAVDILVNNAGAGIYGAGKAALELLTKLWADEFGTQGVRVNAVAPGRPRHRVPKPSAATSSRGWAAPPRGGDFGAVSFGDRTGPRHSHV